MRPSFTDTARQKRSAKKAVSEGSSYIRRWWSNKYKRPPTDPLFEASSLAEWVHEMYEDLYERKAEIEAQLEDEMTPMKERTFLMTRLRNVNKILQEDLKDSDDPLIDRWEQELLEGKVPDLDERT